MAVHPRVITFIDYLTLFIHWRFISTGVICSRQAAFWGWYFTGQTIAQQAGASFWIRHTRFGLHFRS